MLFILLAVNLQVGELSMRNMIEIFIKESLHKYITFFIMEDSN